MPLFKGKTAIFRAVVKGDPSPEVKWTRMQGGMDDPAKYETFFNQVTNEYILQVKISCFRQDSWNRESNGKEKPAVG